MNWPRLFQRLNPAAYERVKCDFCNGSGFELADGKPRFSSSGPVRCEKCHGKGWLIVKKDSD